MDPLSNFYDGGNCFKRDLKEPWAIEKTQKKSKLSEEDKLEKIPSNFSEEETRSALSDPVFPPSLPTDELNSAASNLVESSEVEADCWNVICAFFL
jgi:hypothetical protein